jgi:hypothetical protein
MVGLSSHHGGRRQIRTEAAAFELNTGLLRQGQTVALNMVEQREKFTAVSLEPASQCADQLCRASRKLR